MSSKNNKKQKRNRIFIWTALIVMGGSVLVSLIVSLMNFM